MRKISRKSIYLNNDVMKNEIICEDDFILKRPGIGINPMEYQKIIGRRYSSNLRKGDLLKKEDIL